MCCRVAALLQRKQRAVHKSLWIILTPHRHETTCTDALAFHTPAWLHEIQLKRVLAALVPTPVHLCQATVQATYTQ